MEKFYQRMLSYIRKRPNLEKLILSIIHYFPYITFFLYPCLLIYLYINKSSLLIETIWKPFAAFFVVTILRKLYDRPRPYEAMDIIPLKKHKNGESFPSRHAVSSMIIALVCFNVSFYLGIFAFIVATLMCMSRILSGVHYMSDVVISILIAFVFYLM